MSWTFNTGDRYHTQDTSYYCGAACAMMTLAEIGVPYASLDQVDLYDSNHSHNVQSSWYTDPYGLCYTLDDRRPASFLPRYFVVYKRLTEAEGTRDVAFTLYHYEVSRPSSCTTARTGTWCEECRLTSIRPPARTRWKGSGSTIPCGIRLSPRTAQRTRVAPGGFARNGQRICDLYGVAK